MDWLAKTMLELLTMYQNTFSSGNKPNEVVSPGRECKVELHWHHFYTTLVSAWLANCMLPAILLKESKEMFSPIIANVYQNNPDILEYYSTGEHTDTQLLLDLTRNISGYGYGAAKSKEC